jgi:hypothetical protein
MIERQIAPIQSIVAFIDILGFADKVLHVNSAEEMLELDKELEGIQTRFDFLNVDGSVKQDHGQSRTVLAFSDCVVVTMPLPQKALRMSHEEKVQLGIGADLKYLFVLRWMRMLALAQYGAVLMGTYLRAGLARGWWQSTELRVMSSALVSAYRREQTACMPVFALTHDLAEAILESSEPHSIRLGSDKIIAFDRYVHPDTNETIWFIDYLRSILTLSMPGENAITLFATSRQNETRSQETNRKAKLATLEAHGGAINRALERTTDARVAQKYQWLAAYDDRVCAQFMRETEHLHDWR